MTFARLASAIAALLLLLPLPNALTAHAAPSAKPRIISEPYEGASFTRTPVGDQSLPSYTGSDVPAVGNANVLAAELPLIGTDRYVTVRLDDLTGRQVGGRVGFRDADGKQMDIRQVFCGKSARITIPRFAEYLFVQPALTGLCPDAAIRGTVVATLSPAAPARRRR